MICGILLAAGASRRFGSDKLLCRLPDGVAIGAAAARNLVSAVGQVVAVVGPGDDRRAKLLSEAGAIVVTCPSASQGMGVSLAWGIKASAAAEGWLVALADMPFVRSATSLGIAQLLQAGAALAVPVYRGRRGHPVGFSRQFVKELTSLQGDSGACGILQAQKERITWLPVDDPGIGWDIDVPKDVPDSPQLPLLSTKDSATAMAFS